MIRFNAVSCIVLIGRVLIANCPTGSIVNAYLEGHQWGISLIILYSTDTNTYNVWCDMASA